MLQSISGRWAVLFSIPNLLGTTVGLLVALLVILILAKARHAKPWPVSEIWPGLLFLWWMFACTFANTDYRLHHQGEPFWVGLISAVLVVVGGLALILLAVIADEKLRSKPQE